MLYYLEQLENFYGPFRLFRYLSFRCVMASATAMMIGWLIAPYAINILHKIKFGQSFRTESEVGQLANLHSAKKGTPTMGGIIIYISLIISILLWCQLNMLVLAAIFVYTTLTILGFADDYLKIKRKNSDGVSGKIKISIQILVAVGFVVMMLNSPYSQIIRELHIPFFKDPIISMMPICLLIIFVFLVIGGSSNAINLTDGVDGLAIGCTISVALAYSVLAYITSHAIWAGYLFLPVISGAGELCVLCCALLGASMAFLWYNAHPAQIFMGDTGSLALGGLIGSIAIMVQQPITLVIIGGIFVMEAGSVILQVASFKLTKKRIFRCSPIHHHFEYLGWKETQVVIRFWILSLIFALAGLATLKIR